jgi:hypothetical protein
MSIYNGDIKVAGAGATTLATPTANGLMAKEDKVRLDTPSFAQLQFGSVQQNFTGAWAKFTRFTNYISQGTDFTGDVTSQSFTCNFTGYVEVSAKLYCNGVTVGDLLYIGVVNNADVKAFNILKMATTGDVYNMIIPLILPVTSGNILTLHVMNLTAARGACGSSGSATAADYFTVRRI